LQQSKQQAQQAQQKLQQEEQNVTKTKTELTKLQAEYRSAQQASEAAEQNVQQAKRRLTEAETARQRIVAEAKSASLKLELADVRLKSAASKELFLSDRPFGALLEGLRAAQQLKPIDRSDWKTDDTQAQVVAALQQAVYGVREQNILAHDDTVFSVSFSPDGQMIASGSVDQTIKLWKRDGTLITTLKGHDAVWSVSFSPDGQTIASGSDDKTIKLWKRDGTLITTLKGHDAAVRSVSFSPDGQTIASGSFDKTIKLWNWNIDSLMNLGCSWVHDYLRTNPNVSESDRAMCGITSKK